jgi:hypothetical protein
MEFQLIEWAEEKHLSGAHRLKVSLISLMPPGIKQLGPSYSFSSNLLEAFSSPCRLCTPKAWYSWQHTSPNWPETKWQSIQSNLLVWDGMSTGSVLQQHQDWELTMCFTTQDYCGKKITLFLNLFFSSVKWV